VSPLGPTPQPLFDLPSGASQIVQVRYQFSLLTGPCKLIILNCAFHSTVTVNMPDALDAPHVLTATAPSKAPALPPPL
jgi:hypothetical protein